MKWLLVCYCALAFSLTGCQHFPSAFGSRKQEQELPPPPPPEPKVHAFEQAVRFGANFALEYKKKPDDTCVKYKQLYQQGKWCAGWVLALQVNGTKVQSCLKVAEAMSILTTLESEKKIDSELIWISQSHLRLLQNFQKTTVKISKLRRVSRSHKKKMTELQELNQAQKELNQAQKELNQAQHEKLEALKAIETNIYYD